jgi:hypothetical protein
VTHLIAEEDGPADLVLKLRSRLGSSVLGTLMDCFQCLSLWIAIPFAFVVTRAVIAWVIAWLALSGAACLLERLGTVRAAMPMEPTAFPEENHHDVLRPRQGDVEG